MGWETVLIILATLATATVFGFVSPTRLAADAVVLDACWGVVPDDGVYHPDATVGGRLLSGPWTTSLLATYRIQVTSLRRFDEAIARYRAGASLGELVAELNRTGDSMSWVLWGDPEREGATSAPHFPPASQRLCAARRSCTWSRE